MEWRRLERLTWLRGLIRLRAPFGCCMYAPIWYLWTIYVHILTHVYVFLQVIKRSKWSIPNVNKMYKYIYCYWTAHRHEYSLCNPCNIHGDDTHMTKQHLQYKYAQIRVHTHTHTVMEKLRHKYSNLFLLPLPMYYYILPPSADIFMKCAGTLKRFFFALSRRYQYDQEGQHIMIYNSFLHTSENT